MRILVFLLLITGAVKAQKPVFKSDAGQEEVILMYNEKLKALPFENEHKLVSTSFGKTSYIESGIINGEPLILVHGINACAPLTIDAVPGLNEKYHVFTVDIPGEPNTSAPTRLKKNKDDYGKWINEVIDGLKLDSVTLVGVSLGGYIVLKSASYNDSKIKEIWAIVPGGIANGSMGKMYKQAYKPMKAYKKNPTQENLKAFMKAATNEENDFTERWMGSVLLNVNIDKKPIPKLKKKHGKKITKPIYIFTSKNDLFFPGEKVAKKAQKIFPTLKEVIFLENSAHIPSKEDSKLIVDRITR